MRRRRYLKLGTLGLGFLAGCSGQSDQSNPTSTTTSTRTRRATATQPDSGAQRTTQTETPTPTPRENPDTIFVSADATEGGVGTKDDPLGSVQAAVEEAGPGQTVQLLPGEYRENITTVRDGEDGAPITITGPPEAIVHGSRDDYGIVRIHHSHIHLTGLTIEGLLPPGQPDQLISYVSGQLIQTRPPHSTDEYLEDIVIAPHNIGYSRKSLIGLERTKNAEIGPLRVTGLAGADYLVGDEDDHNGELFYIGTALSNLGSDWHPWTDLDETRDVRIHHIDNSAGHEHAEAVDFKEGTADITVEYMTDYGGGRVTDDDTPAAISFKSHNGTVRWCDLGDAPILVEFDFDHEDIVHDNVLYGNRLHEYSQHPIDVAGTALSELSQEDLDRFAETGSVVCRNDIDGRDDHPAQRDCASDRPTASEIGHTGGQSPW